MLNPGLTSMNKNRHSNKRKRQSHPDKAKPYAWRRRVGKGEKRSGSFEQTLYILRTLNSVRD